MSLVVSPRCVGARCGGPKGRPIRYPPICLSPLHCDAPISLISPASVLTSAQNFPHRAIGTRRVFPSSCGRILPAGPAPARALAAPAAHVRGASNRSHDLATGQPVAKDTTQSIADLTMPIPTPSHPRSPDSRSSHLPRQYPAQLAAAAAQQQQWPPKIAPNLGPRGRTTTH